MPSRRLAPWGEVEFHEQRDRLGPIQAVECDVSHHAQIAAAHVVGKLANELGKFVIRCGSQRARDEILLQRRQ